MRSMLSLAFAGIFAIAAASSTLAHGFKLGELEIGHPWSRATPGQAQTGAGYMTIKNTGSTDDRLIAAETAMAGKSELHLMQVTDGVMTMRQVDGGVVLPAGETVTLAPGGLHVMMMGLTGKLVEGETFPLTLTFEKAGTVTVEIKVEPIGYMGPGAKKGDAQGHDAGGHGSHGGMSH